MIKQIRYIFVVVVVVVRSDINHIKLQLHIVKDYKLIYKKKNETNFSSLHEKCMKLNACFISLLLLLFILIKLYKYNKRYQIILK